MPTYTLTVLDVTGIQDYIFGSNRLSENVGASQIVHQATTTWVREGMDEAKVRHNLGPDDTIDALRWLEQDEALDAEVILRGGGNALILFRTPEFAKATVGKLTRKLIIDAPGLEIAVAHHTFDWTTPVGGPDGAHHKLYEALNQTKQQRRGSAPLLGLGVTLECRSTGLPAVGYAPPQGEDDTTLRPVSAEVLAKLDKTLQTAAQQRLTALLPEVEPAGYRFRREFGTLGGTEGEMSYIAVVHADGNGIGKLFEKVIMGYPEAAQNRACLNALRNLSNAVDQAGQDALRATIQRMMAAFSAHEAPRELKDFLQSLHAVPKTRHPILPFRPIVYGGDDVTFVCDGRLGLALAAIYLEEWERVTKVSPTIGAAHACAGVAIVKSHYPFVRAYTLAGALCTGAKRAVREALRDHPELSASALDWHFAMSGIGGTIKQIRDRECQGKAGPMHLRPVALHAPILKPNWYTWATFDRVTRDFQSGPDWRARRNKVKELREVLREGPVAVERFRRAFTLNKLPVLDAGKAALQQTGWDGATCGYFDPIEALDFYLPLTEKR